MSSTSRRRKKDDFKDYRDCTDPTTLLSHVPLQHRLNWAIVARRTSATSNQRSATNCVSQWQMGWINFLTYIGHLVEKPGISLRVGRPMEPFFKQFQVPYRDADGYLLLNPNQQELDLLLQRIRRSKTLMRDLDNFLLDSLLYMNSSDGALLFEAGTLIFLILCKGGMIVGRHVASPPGKSTYSITRKDGLQSRTVKSQKLAVCSAFQCVIIRPGASCPLG